MSLGNSGEGGPGCSILNDIAWVGQSTEVSWRRPSHSDCTSRGQRFHRNHAWRTNCKQEYNLVLGVYYSDIMYDNRSSCSELYNYKIANTYIIFIVSSHTTIITLMYNIDN